MCGDFRCSIMQFKAIVLLFLQAQILWTSKADSKNNTRVTLEVTLSPNYVIVNESQMAVFYCTYSCDVLKQHSHGVYWHVGVELKHRGFPSRRARWFTRKTGLHVEAEDISTCDEVGNGSIIHQLKINATSSTRWNKTPIQCVAVRSNPEEVDFYSPYGLLFITPTKTDDSKQNEDISVDISLS